MPGVTECPTCGRKLRAPESLLGQSVQCPGCGSIFAVSAPADEPRPLSTPASEEEDLERHNTDPAPPQSPDVPRRLAVDDDETPFSQARGLPPPPRPFRPVPVPVPPDPEDKAGLKRCPRCSEQVPRNAHRCRFCGESLEDVEDRPWEGPNDERVRRDCEPHRGGLILTLGIIGMAVLGFCPLVGLPLSIAAWSMAQSDLDQMEKRLMDPAGKGTTNAGRVLGIVGTVLNTIYGLCGLAYFLLAIAG